MQVTPTEIPAVLLIEPKVFGDARGFFVESWHGRRYAEAGITAVMVQDNMSRSAQGVLRGLHYQWPMPQAKLVYVLEGEIVDLAVDVRVGSPTFGRSVSVVLTAESKRQIFVPEGFAHGFCVLSPSATVAYKCSAYYAPQYDRGVRWNDPHLAIDWPVQNPLLSEKDARLPLLGEVPLELLPRYQAAADA
jgi:dTDP-4-dehydrorhamnose 3,5-epimerase